MRPALLLSLRPKFALAIYEGRKRIEFRRLAPRCSLPIKAYIYETRPVGRVTGIVDVVDIIQAPVGELLKLVDASDLLRADYRSYLSGASNPCGLLLERAQKFMQGATISELFDNLSRPPQSFCYVSGRKR